MKKTSKSKYVLMVTSRDDQWGDYPLMNLTPKRIKLINDTPFDGVGVMLCGLYCGKAPLPDEKVLKKAKEIKKILKKDLWARININRTLERRDNHKVKRDQEYFERIKGMDIDNSTGALEDFYTLWRQGLKIAKETSSPGIILDMELYHDNHIAHVDFIARKRNIPIGKVIKALRKIGAHLADIAYQEHPTVKILILHDLFNSPVNLIEGKAYRESGEYIAESLLARAKEKNIPLQLIAGGEGNIGYVNRTLDTLKEKIKRRNNKMQPELKRFGAKLDLGSTIVVWDDPGKISGWTKTGAGPHTQYKRMEDFVPNIKMLLDSYDFLWIYVPTCTDYNPYDPKTAEALNKKLAKVIEEAKGTKNILELTRTDKQLHINGKPDGFLSSIKHVELKKHPNGGAPKEKTYAWAFYDKNNLYVAFKCFESEMSNLKKELKGRDKPLYQDDCVEIFLVPGSDKKEFYQFVINPNGELFDAVYEGGRPNATWNAKAQVASGIFNDFWFAEIAISLANFKWNPEDMRMSINLCRERMPSTQSEELSSFAVLKQAGFKAPDKFIPVKPLLNTVVASCAIEKTDPGFFIFGENELSVLVKNLLNKKRHFILEFKLLGANLKSQIFREEKSLPPKAAELLQLRYKFSEKGYTEYEINLLEKGNLIYSVKKPIKGAARFTVPGTFFLPGEKVPLVLNINLPEWLRHKAALNIELLKDGKSLFRNTIENAYSGACVQTVSIPKKIKGKCALKLILTNKQGNKLYYVFKRNIDILNPEQLERKGE